MTNDQPASTILVTVPGSPDDPRNQRAAPPGVLIPYAPPLHPDDVTEVHGIPVTSVARTLIDCAEELPTDELREMFSVAFAKRLVDIDAIRASRARVEWRPPLAMLDEVIEEFADRSGGGPATDA
jgi:hypothetical protein